jgi:hypothetical protein
MFVCANCRKQKPDDERGSVGLLGNIGFFLALRFPWWPSEACKDCSKQVRIFGVACLFIVAIIVVIFVDWKRLL